MKKIALLTLLLINLSLSFSLPRNQASPAIFSVTQSAGTILFRHTDSTQTIIPCQSVASIVSNADPSKVVSVWVVQQGDYDKIMQFDYSVCGFSTKQEAVDSVTVWASCLYVSDSAYTTILYTNTDSATITSYDVLNSQNAPPGSPATGDTYLVGTSPSGAWVGHAKDIAEWNGSSWDFTDGIQGDFLYNATTALTYIFRSGNWVQTTGIPALHNGNNISSGLKIGTNNARSLTFETNNASRGRFDSVGRFHIYNLPISTDTFVNVVDENGKFGKVGKSSFLSGGSGIESVVAGDNITVDDTDPLNPIVSASGGGSTTADNGLTKTLDNVQLGGNLIKHTEVNGDNDTYSIDFKRINSFSVGAIASSQLADNNTIGVKTGSGVQNILTAAIRNLTALPGQVLTLVNENTGQVEYQNVTVQDIPLTGTEVGSPVTGDIEFGGDIAIKTLNGDGNNFHSLTFSDGAIISKFNNNIYETALFVSDDIIISSGNANFKGIVGNNDWSSNYTDLSYTQKIYVGFRGTATLSSGTVTVATDKVKTGYKIYLSVNTPSGTQGFLSAPTGSIVDATSFVINSTNAGDNSTVNWWIAP